MRHKILLKTVIFLLFLLTCVFSTIDTQLFVYPSLSRYLFLEVGMMAMAVVWLCALFVGNGMFRKTGLHLFVVLWIAYIVLHGIISQSYESYRSVYLCVTLGGIIVLVGIQKERWLFRHDIETVLIVIAGINIIYIICQEAGVIDSGNVYFEVTGCNENPTVTALYLVGCLPLLVARTVQTKLRAVYFPFIVITVICIMLLRCRTAYVGMAVMAIIVLSVKLKYCFPMAKSHPFYLVSIGIVLLAFISLASAKMYIMKKDSTDGRLLVWKISSGMIKERPQGYGYGLFEKYYNLRQADYFADENYTRQEKSNADFVYMPYNDYLEHGVEGGFAGMFFLVVFYFCMIRRSVHSKDTESTAVFCAFAVMSLFNFVYTSISPWLLIICYSSFVLAEERTFIWKYRQRLAGILLLFPIAAFSYNVFKVTVSQLRLKRIDSSVREEKYMGDKNFAEIESYIGTSEAFWTKRAINNIKAGYYAEALENIHKARAYSSFPNLFIMEYHCQKALADVDAGIMHIDTLSYMMPNKLTFKYILMQYYVSINHLGEALHHANDILSTDVKVQSEKANGIINHAKLLKEKYHE